MKSLNQIIARMFLANAILLPPLLHGAQIELLSNMSVRVATGATNSDHIAVDISSNLVNWASLTNVAAAAGQITFVNDPLQSDPARFFRFADGDNTFAIAGYVDGGPAFGGVAGATVSESSGGTKVTTDARGFFHFDQRFSRTNFPLNLVAFRPGLLPSQRQITTADAGTFSILQVGLGSPAQISPARTIFHFTVVGGSHAGMQYTMVFLTNRFEMFGHIAGEGFFDTSATTSSLRYNFSGGPTNELFIWPGETNFTGVSGWFSGMPLFVGNGSFTSERLFAPDSLDGLAFSIGANQIQFTNHTYTLFRQGASTSGPFSELRYGNDWKVSLLSDVGVGDVGHLTLSFKSLTDGDFSLDQPGQPFSTGSMVQIPYPPAGSGGGGEPVTLSTLRVTVATGGVGAGTMYTISLSGGASGTFTTIDDIGNSHGRGTYTYTSTGTSSALLTLNYGAEFAGDNDIMNLTFNAPAGASQPSTFSGTQRISGSVYPFTGTFTY